MKISFITACALAMAVAAAPILPAQGGSRTIEVHVRSGLPLSRQRSRSKKGEAVTLSLISDDVPHSLLVEGLGVNTAAVKGHPTTVTITPSKTGDFAGRCGRFCGSGHGEMHFVVHVTE